MTGVQTRLAFRNAVWACSDLRPTEKLVLLAFEKYAGNGLDSVWVSGTELRRLTGLSRNGTTLAVRALESKGWLVQIEKPRQHRSARYRLVVPSDQMYLLGTSGLPPDVPVGTPDVPVGTPDVPVRYPNREATTNKNSSARPTRGRVPTTTQRVNEALAVAERLAGIQTPRLRSKR